MASIPKQMIQLTPDQVAAIASAHSSDAWWASVTYDDTSGLLAVPAANAATVRAFDYTAAAASATASANKLAALAALDKSDVTLLRCIEAGVSVPPEWTAYRRALRAIVTSGAALPVRPAYPNGT